MTSLRHTTTQLLDSFVVNSRREYFIVDRAHPGGRLYTDQPALCWAHLPSALHGQRYISTPCDDYASKYWDLIRFTVRRPSMVVVLSEASCGKPPPDWLLREGYRRLVSTTIARRAMTAAEGHTSGSIGEWGVTACLVPFLSLCHCLCLVVVSVCVALLLSMSLFPPLLSSKCPLPPVHCSPFSPLPHPTSPHPQAASPTTPSKSTTTSPGAG